MKKVINIIFILLILGLMIWLGINIYTENKIPKNTIGLYNTVTAQANNTKNEQTQNQIIKQEIEKEYKGYKVSAKLEIPAISLETYVLETYSTKALNISVAKFWGADPNQIGNFCIAGHNFNKPNMFKNLKKLQIGDTIYISDNDNGKIEYKVYNLYKVLPQDVSCLSQDTQGKRETTLITCTNDSKQRIIVKAKEI